MTRRPAPAEGRTDSMNLTMSWGLDLVTPFEGCPAGTAWDLTGPNHTANGTETVPCGVPM